MEYKLRVLNYFSNSRNVTSMVCPIELYLFSVDTGVTVDCNMLIRPNRREITTA